MEIMCEVNCKTNMVLPTILGDQNCTSAFLNMCVILLVFPRILEGTLHFNMYCDRNFV